MTLSTCFTSNQSSLNKGSQSTSKNSIDIDSSTTNRSTLVIPWHFLNISNIGLQIYNFRFLLIKVFETRFSKYKICFYEKNKVCNLLFQNLDKIVVQFTSLLLHQCKELQQMTFRKTLRYQPKPVLNHSLKNPFIYFKIFLHHFSISNKFLFRQSVPISTQIRPKPNIA